jgi:hypothetical protein
VILCVNCGDEAQHKHHVVPRSLGGLDVESNLVWLCLECHGKIHGRDFVRYKELQRQGIEKAKARGAYKGRQKSISRLAICMLNTAGYSTYAIADALDISRMTVHRCLNDEGLKHVRVIPKDLSQLNLLGVK